MAREPPHMRLFTIRCTLLAFFALVWSMLLSSKPEFAATSLHEMTEKQLDKQLNAVVITGGVFLGINTVLTLLSFSLRCIAMHYFQITLHAIGILLVILSILNYWNVLLLWIPTAICCIFPAIVEIVFDICKAIGKCAHI